MSRGAAPLVRRRVAPHMRRHCVLVAVQVKALTLQDAPNLMNSILYMYLHVLLKYNARVAVKAQQLTRRRVEIHHLTSIGIVLVPSSKSIGASLMLQSAHVFSNPW
jgi:hypothetical protein